MISIVAAITITAKSSETAIQPHTPRLRLGDCPSATFSCMAENVLTNPLDAGFCRRVTPLVTPLTNPSTKSVTVYNARNLTGQIVRKLSTQQAPLNTKEILQNED